MTKEQRRKIIAKRNAALKSRATWRKKLQGGDQESIPSSDEFGGVPETDAALDELPDTLVG